MQPGDISASHLQGVEHKLGQSLMLLSPEGVAVHVSEGLARLLGAPLARIAGRHWSDVLGIKAGHKHAVLQSLFDYVNAHEGSVVPAEMPFEVQGMVSAAAISLMQFSPFPGTHTVAVSVQPWASEKPADLAGRNARALLERMADIVLMGVFEGAAHNEPKILYANAALQELSGYPPGEVVGQPLIGSLIRDGRTGDTALTVRTLLEDGLSASFPLLCRRKDGESLWVHADFHLCAESGPGHWVAYMRDITQQRYTENKLEAEKNRLAITLESIGDAVITSDEHGRITSLNPAAEHLLRMHRNKAVGKFVRELFALHNVKDKRPIPHPLERALETRLSIDVDEEVILQTPDGTEHFVIYNVAPIHTTGTGWEGAVLVINDVTQRVRLGEELQKTDKLESLGLMARRIAHDFNNLLTVIRGRLSIAKAQIAENEEIYSYVDTAENAAEQAFALTRQIRNFADGDVYDPEIIDVGELVKQSGRLMLQDSKHSCEVHLTDGLWPVNADAGMINQVLNNLVLNAAQAMPEGGKIRLEASNVSKHGELPLTLSKNNYVRIRIRDEGCGISPQNLQKIFDPYYTTKETGSGLGLSSVYNIIYQHGGHIGVTSTLGKGTVFTIHLPADTDHAGRFTREDTAAASDTPAPRPPSAEAGARGRVLVMDDEKIILSTASDLLTFLGYEPVCAIDGDEAVNIYREAFSKDSQAFVAVILDLNVPGGMGAFEALPKLKEIDAEVRTVLSSGHRSEFLTTKWSEVGFTAYVPKPYNLQQLEDALSKIAAPSV